MTTVTENDTGGDFRARPEPVRATVAAVLSNGLFSVRLEDGSERLAHVAGDLRMAFSRLLPGDVVHIELSPLDPTKARIGARAAHRRPPATTRASEIQP